MLRSLIIIFSLVCLNGRAFAQSELDEYGAKAREIIERSQTKELQDLFNEALSRSDDVDVEAIDLEKTTHDAIKLIEKERDIKIGPQFQEKSDSVPNGDLIVFISLSMPDELIEQYVVEAGKYDARLVIKGLIDGDFAKTTNRMRSLMKDKKEGVRGVSMDHRVFDFFDVVAVPTIVFSEDRFDLCTDGHCADGVGRVDRMVGAVSIGYALEQFADSGDNSLFAKERF